MGEKVRAADLAKARRAKAAERIGTLPVSSRETDIVVGEVFYGFEYHFSGNIKSFVVSIEGQNLRGLLIESTVFEDESGAEIKHERKLVSGKAKVPGFSVDTGDRITLRILGPEGVTVDAAWIRFVYEF